MMNPDGPLTLVARTLVIGSAKTGAYYLNGSFQRTFLEFSSLPRYCCIPSEEVLHFK